MAGAAKPQPSAIDELIDQHIQHSPASSSHLQHLHALALEVKHNLQHQQDWTAIALHTHSPLNLLQLPRPLLSGLPPHPVYIHPDQQIGLIKAGIEEKDAPKKREWVLPTHLKEKWSLKAFAEVFDAIKKGPLDVGEVGQSEEQDERARTRMEDENELKRLLLATVDEDSTVAYYIVHDGVMKPRQN